MGTDQNTSYLFDETVAQDYEAWYEQGFGRWAVQQEETLLRQQLKTFPGAVTILDVGCGTGHFSRWFAQQGLQVVGLDESPAMLEQARMCNGIRYMQGDALALPFEDRSFDLVAMITVLEFVADPVQVLREVLRVARQGLLLGVLNHQSLIEQLRRLRGQRPIGVLAQAHRFNVRELTGLVRHAGRGSLLKIAWRTTIFPARLPLSTLHLPWGEYLGVSVHLASKGG